MASYKLRAAPDADPKPARPHTPAENFPQALILILSVILLTAVCIAMLVKIGEQVWEPEYKILTFLLVSVVGLTLSLTVMAVTLHLFGLSDPKQALALPEGSIRSVLALSLMIVFSLLFFFLYGSLSTPTPARTRPLTDAQASEAVAQLKDVFLYRETLGTGTDARYVVHYRSASNQDAVDVGKQGLTAILTLLASVVSFYFGARTAIDSSIGGASSALSTLARGAAADGAGTETSPLSLNGVSPPAADAGSALNLTLTGTSLQSVNQVALRRNGTSPIVATAVSAATATSVSASFTLPAGAQKAGWDVFVQRVDGETAELPGGFTIT